MAPLTKGELLDRVLAAIRSSGGWLPLVIRSRHPFLITAVRRDESIRLRVYIWNLTRGGPSTVRPADEWRIQLTGVNPPLIVDNDTVTLLLGWHEGFRTFAGYDVSRHKQFGTSASLQVREATLAAAIETGMHPQQRTSKDIVIAFAPDQFMHYAVRQADLHQFRDRPQFEILASAAAGTDVPEEELGEADVPERRRSVIKNVQQWSRDRSFRKRVLSAYKEHCAICSIQLELVEAAHIIPVGHPKSNDRTRNGLCLCPLHHEAYDRGLLVVWPDYHVRADVNRLSDLIAKGLGKGADDIRALECKTIFLPHKKSDQPHPGYLREGLIARGWTP